MEEITLYNGFGAILSSISLFLPLFVWTITISCLFAWIFADRSYTSGTETIVTKWYVVHQYWRVVTLVTVYSFFGSIQGYLIGSLPDQQSQLIASMVPAAITTAATYIGLFSAQILNDNLRRSLSPAILGFLACFVFFTQYHTLTTTNEALLGTTNSTQTPSSN